MLEFLKGSTKKSESNQIENSIQQLTDLMKMRDKDGSTGLHLLSEKLKGIKSGSEVINDQITSETGPFSSSASAQLCYRELAILLQILEKCFVDNYDSQTTTKVIKELILRADQTLLLARKQSLNLFSITNDQVKRDVDTFLGNIMPNQKTQAQPIGVDCKIFWVQTSASFFFFGYLA